MPFASFWETPVDSGSALTIAGCVGIFFIIWKTGNIAKMNAAAALIAVLFCAWVLEGEEGPLLAIPIIGIGQGIVFYQSAELRSWLSC